MLGIMRRIHAAVLLFLFNSYLGIGQTDPGFAGTWRLNPDRSDLRNLPVPAEPVLTVEQSGSS